MRRCRIFFLTAGLIVLLGWPSSGWAFHTWKKGKLPNGLTLLVVEKPDTPTVSLTLLIKRGATSEPPGKRGVASLTARLLTEGTRQRSSDQIAERIAALGGEFVADASFDDTTLEWVVLKQDLAPALEVLADVVQHPAFPQAAVQRERTAAIAERRAKTADTPEALLLRHVFGTGPYGLPASGEAASLTHLERQDVVRFHRQAYRPEEAILAAAGDVTLAEVETLAKKYFGNWSAAAKVEASRSSLSVKTEPVALVVDRPLVQASVRLAFVGAPAADPAVPALRLLSRLLAGSPESRLGRTLREQNGWTYTVWSELEPFQQTGLFFIGMSLPYEVILPALQETVREIMCLQAEPVSEAELERVKQESAIRFYFKTESIRDLSHLVAQYEASTPGQEPPDHRLTALQRVTAAEIQRVARQYLDPRKAVVSVVGDREALHKFAPSVAEGKAPQWAMQCGGENQ